MSRTLGLALSLLIIVPALAQETPDESSVFQEKLERLLDRWNDDVPSDRLGQAIDLCEKHLKTKADDPVAALELARFKLAKGDADGAVLAAARAEDLAASQPERLKQAKALSLVAYSVASTQKAASQEQLDAYQKKFVDLYNKLATLAGSRDAADELVNSERERVNQATVLNALGKAPVIKDRKDTEGKPVALDAYLGKIVLIDFWSASYEPYEKEIANTVSVYQANKARLEAIGISLDKDRAALDAFVTANKVPWRQIFSGKGLNDDTARAWGVPGVRRYLLDHDGKVRFVNVRGDGLAAAVKQLVERLEKAGKK